MGNSAKPTPVRALHFLTIGSVPRTLAEKLVAQVSRRVALPCRLLTNPFLGEVVLLPDREQVDADSLLERLEKKAPPGTILVGMTMRDLGTKIFSFVFGQARRNGHAALVSLARLRQEFYGLADEPELTTGRAVTEILHELGHVAGLLHCSDFACLMHFATNVEMIDLRGDSFCTACASRLPSDLLHVGPHHLEH